jgi:hypothetical protein
LKIKLDENLAERLVPALRSFGHDVNTVRAERLVGRDDADVWRTRKTGTPGLPSLVTSWSAASMLPSGDRRVIGAPTGADAPARAPRVRAPRAAPARSRNRRRVRAFAAADSTPQLDEDTEDLHKRGPSLVSQRHHRVASDGASSRNIPGEASRHEHHDGRTRKRRHVQRLDSMLAYPEFLYLPDSPGALPRPSYARVTELQAVYAPHLEPMDAMLAPEALAVFQSQIQFMTTGSYGGTLEAYREQLLHQILAALLHEQAVFVHMGATLNKNQELDVIKSGGIVYKNVEIQEASVRLIGTTAILLNKIRLVAVVGGSEVTNPFVVTEVYVQQAVRESWPR